MGMNTEDAPSWLCAPDGGWWSGRTFIMYDDGTIRVDGVLYNLVPQDEAVKHLAKAAAELSAVMNISPTDAMTLLRLARAMLEEGGKDEQ